jgi:hypothetical protein
MGEDELISESDMPYPLDWAHVECAAKSAFAVWVGQPELAWAKKALDFLPGHGLFCRERRLQ